ncbi:hypothetical protein N7539_000883 [Penicillium diatomitis]|uniref:Uncharacterized protein n=1 Tax=Penicillium diatomitis TaxID=2819901 RepID=A0A9W9XMJ3_9EURO|nr:uncharacterized protein N7539_000883 [Penicillium diatomitis]KAJ5495767.1 hypothetical protein N7539_000883 [Penicillium diatomitis]
MAEVQSSPLPASVSGYDYFSKKPELAPHSDAPFLPYWARSPACAQNLLDCSNEPIEYDHDDEDYSDNCFFFPEDCSWTPPKDWVVEAHRQPAAPTADSHPINLPSHHHLVAAGHNALADTMIPGLPDIKMLDSEALGDLLEDNLSPPEITTMIVFATNGAVFAYASSLASRQLRNLSSTYGAAYTCYAKTASSGNLTGVNPASHPSSYVTAPSMSLGDVGSIVFELDDSVAVVTRVADKVLLAAVGPKNLDENADGPTADGSTLDGPVDPGSGIGNGTGSDETQGNHAAKGSASNGAPASQQDVDRSADLSRLASLNLSASPSVLLALESKCAALGRFLAEKLDDLESPEDF